MKAVEIENQKFIFSDPENVKSEVWSTNMVQMELRTQVPVLGCTFKSAMNFYFLVCLMCSLASIFWYLFVHFEDFQKNNLAENSSLTFCYYVVDLWTTITGLYAMEKKRPSLLIPFIVYRIFDVLLLVVMLLFFYEDVMSGMVPAFETALIVVFGVKDKVILLEVASMMVIVGFLIIFGFKLFFAFVVYEYYYIMKNQLLGKGRAFAKLQPGPACYVMLR